MTRRGGQRARHRRKVKQTARTASPGATDHVMAYTISAIAELRKKGTGPCTRQEREALLSRFDQLRSLVNSDRRLRVNVPASLRRAYEAEEGRCNDAFMARWPNYATLYASRLEGKRRVLERMRRVRECRDMDRGLALVTLLQAGVDWKKTTGLTCLDERVLRSSYESLRLSISRRIGLTRQMMRQVMRTAKMDLADRRALRNLWEGRKKFPKD